MQPLLRRQKSKRTIYRKSIKKIQKGRFKSCNLVCTLQHLDPTCFLFKFEGTLLCQKSHEYFDWSLPSEKESYNKK